MSQNPEEIDLLLNGLLDGALTDEEQTRIELAMAQDPSLGVRFEEMNSLRRSLLVGRRRGRLGSDFATRVVMAARERADQMGTNAPVWLTPNTPTNPSSGAMDQRSRGRREHPVTAAISSHADSGTDVSEPFASDSVIISQRAWRVWLPALSLGVAASLAMVMLSVMWPPSPTLQPFAGVSEVPQGSNDSSSNDFATELLSPKDTVAKDTVAKDTVAKDTVKNDTGATSDIDSAIASNANQAPLSNSLNNPDPATTPTESLETNGVKGMASTLAEALVPNVEALVPNLEKPTDPTSKAIDDLIASKSVANPIFTMVAEITVDPVAAGNDSLRTLMEEHEILVTDDLNLDKIQLETLVSSQLVGVLNQADIGDRDGVHLFFLRARADRIDSFLMDAFAQYKDFPTYRLDLSFDPAVLKLANQLSTVASSDDYARRLTFRGGADAGLVTMFPHVDKGPGVKLEDRIASSQLRDRSMSKERREMSYLLLMVKPASSK